MQRTHINQGTQYSNLGRYERAIKVYDQAIFLDSQFAATYSNRAEAYRNLGQHERAIQDFEEAIRIDPKDPQVYNNRGHSFDNLGRYGRAIQHYNEAESLPSKCQTYGHRGGAYIELGQPRRGHAGLVSCSDCAVRNYKSRLFGEGLIC